MRHSAILSIMVAVYMSSIRAQSQGYDPEFTLHAYKLTSEMETQFTVDEKLSDFWNEWFLRGEELKSDVLAGMDHYKYGEKPVSREDGGITVRVAYGEKGMYILYEAFDNDWSGIANTDKTWINDGCEFFFDKMSAQEIYNNAPSSFLIPSLGQLTKTSVQVQVRMGGEQPAQTIDVNYTDPSKTPQPSWMGYDDIILYKRDLTLASVETGFGIKIDFVWPQDNPTTRYQEWFVPWSLVGGPGNGMTPASEGEKIAFTYGYNDMDGGQYDETMLRWRNNADPYDADKDSWGDILFDKSVQDVSIHRHHRMVPSFVDRGDILRTDTYDCTGKKLSRNRATNATGIFPVSGIVFQRHTTRSHRSLIERDVFGK